MIFPRECKEVGYARGTPCGDRVYFLTRYLIREVPEGHELLRVESGPGEGFMRPILSTHVLARPEEIGWYPGTVQIHDRPRLVERARAGGARCTIFTATDEHLTFVLDPDPEEFLPVHVYDVSPPAPSLSATLRDLERSGLFGDLDIAFRHHIRDLTTLSADLYPCQASGFTRTLDREAPRKGDRVAACQTGIRILEECYPGSYHLEDICPLNTVREEPFITRCCQGHREGVGEHRGLLGAVVHWSTPPWRTARLVHDLIRAWRER